MEKTIKDLLLLDHNPLIPIENEILLKKITSLKRTFAFEEMRISNEKLDELVENLKQQESFLENIDEVVRDLENIPGTIVYDDSADFI